MPEYSTTDPLPATRFDVIVIGTGVVGCAVARRFALEGVRVLVLEKSVDILDGASKGNSAILHTGFDAPPPGSQELACIADGYREYLDVHARLNLPLLRCGAMVLAWNDAEAERLVEIRRDAQCNGVTDTRLLDAGQARAREPGLGDGLRAALAVPGESVIDPWSAPYAYLLQALENGASLARACEVTGGAFDGEEWVLETSRGPVRASHVIACAGLYGDRLDRMLTGNSLFEIRPRKGQFVVFDKSARSLANSILLPVPSETTKGIVVCPTVFGNLMVGPTAEEQQSRSEASVDTAQLRALIERGRRILPGLDGHAVTAAYAGLRPATEHKDYQIDWRAQLNYCSVGGIRSTGLSAALGIARFVFTAYRDAGGRSKTRRDCAWPRVSPLGEPGPRDWQQPGNRGVVCHCELVTRREIESVLQGPIPPGSLAGLKRRTRATMGRCQGFYCCAELSALTDGCFAQSLDLGEA